MERLKSFERLMKQSKRKLADRVWQLKERILQKEKANAAQALLLDEYRKEIITLKKRLDLLDVSNQRELLSGFASYIHKNMKFLDAHSPHVYIDKYLDTL